MRKDYDYVVKQECASSDTANVGGYHQVGLMNGFPLCDCPGFKFKRKKDKYGNPTCKHIEQAYKEGCFWHQLYNKEVLVENGVCPKCGGQTRYVKVSI